MQTLLDENKLKASEMLAHVNKLHQLSALGSACKFGHVAAVKVLLKYIAELKDDANVQAVINKVDVLGYSPLLYACLQCAESK